MTVPASPSRNLSNRLPRRSLPVAKRPADTNDAAVDARAARSKLGNLMLFVSIRALIPAIGYFAVRYGTGATIQSLTDGLSALIFIWSAAIALLAIISAVLLQTGRWSGRNLGVLCAYLLIFGPPVGIFTGFHVLRRIRSPSALVAFGGYRPMFGRAKKSRDSE